MEQRPSMAHVEEDFENRGLPNTKDILLGLGMVVGILSFKVGQDLLTLAKLGIKNSLVRACKTR